MDDAAASVVDCVEVAVDDVRRRIFRRRRAAYWLVAAECVASEDPRGCRPNRKMAVEEECFYPLGGSWASLGKESALKMFRKKVCANKWATLNSFYYVSLNSLMRIGIWE